MVRTIDFQSINAGSTPTRDANKIKGYKNGVMQEREWKGLEELKNIIDSIEIK